MVLPEGENLSVRGDFNGDGREDVAAVVRAPDRSALVVFHSTGDGYDLMPLYTRLPSGDVQLRLVPAGRRSVVGNAAGGTGGHIYPGIAVANEIVRRDGESEVLFVGTARGLEKKIVPDSGFQLSLIDSAGLKNVGFVGKVKGLSVLPKSFLEARKIIRQFRPHVVVGAGGYVSGPVLLMAAIMGVPTLVVARTDAESAKLITSDVDERDRPFIKSKDRTPEGFYQLEAGVDSCIARGLAYAPYCDLIWWETSHPNLDEARIFAEAVHKQYPGKLLAYNCSPSFNWKAKLDEATIAKFQRELGAMGYKFQFVTLAGFHSLNHGMFELASGYRDRGMAAYSELQQAEFASEAAGYTATRHQREVGTGYFDAIATAVSAGQASTVALEESTEAAQFVAAE